MLTLSAPASVDVSGGSAQLPGVMPPGILPLGAMLPPAGSATLSAPLMPAPALPAPRIEPPPAVPAEPFVPALPVLPEAIMLPVPAEAMLAAPLVWGDIEFAAGEWVNIVALPADVVLDAGEMMLPIGSVISIPSWPELGEIAIEEPAHVEIGIDLQVTWHIE